LSGLRVVICTVEPIELPGYSAENGPYSTSICAMSSGAISDQRGG
jgi:hypothetical protein